MNIASCWSKLNNVADMIIDRACLSSYNFLAFTFLDSMHNHIIEEDIKGADVIVSRLLIVCLKG